MEGNPTFRSRGLITTVAAEVYDGWMQRSSYWMITVMMTPGITFGQERSNGQVKILTVCEALGDVNRYSDTAVANYPVRIRGPL